jgi:hypothetical protein
MDLFGRSRPELAPYFTRDIFLMIFLKVDWWIHGGNDQIKVRGRKRGVDKFILDQNHKKKLNKSRYLSKENLGGIFKNILEVQSVGT